MGWVWLLAAAALGACAAPDRSVDAFADGDDGGDGELESPHQLRWHSEGELLLAPGTSTDIGVTYENADGVPVTDLVDFALVGAAQDASLGAVEARSNEAGAATVTLHASTVPANFRLRASAPLARPILLNVSVANAFGDLRIEVLREGSRELLSQDARLYTDVSCDALMPDALPTEDRWQPGADTVLFAGLAVGPTYSVVVTGQSDGQLVAFGCVSDLRVTDEGATEADVVMTDLTPSPLGEYEVRSRLDLADAVRGRPTTWLDGAHETLDAYGGAADFLIARMHGYVSSAYGSPAGVRFDAAVEDGNVQNALADALTAPERDPHVFLDRLAQDLEAALEAPGLVSLLTIDSGEAACDALHALDALVLDAEALGVDDEVTVPLASLAVVSLANGPCSVSDRDVVLDQHDLAFPLGTIAAGLAEHVLPAFSGAESLPAQLANTLDCDDVASLLADADADEDCDETCLAEACRDASTQLAASITTALRSGDQTLERLVLSGRATLEDEYGDLRAETLAGGLWLGWIEPSHAEIGGSFTAVSREPAF